MPRDVVNLWRRVPREAQSAADIAAVDRGEGRRLFCYYRALYGQYPRRFMACMLDLTADGPVVSPLVFLRFLRQRIPVTEQVFSARVRPFESMTEAVRLLGSGQYGPGQLFEQAGYAVISCQTSRGILEFSVRRPDVPPDAAPFQPPGGQLGTCRPARPGVATADLPNAMQL